MSKPSNKMTVTGPETMPMIKQKPAVEIFKAPDFNQNEKEKKFAKWKRRIFMKPRRVSIIGNTLKTVGFMGTIALSINFIFFWDFGPQKHIFTNLREKTSSLVIKKFFTLTDEEREYISTRK